MMAEPVPARRLGWLGLVTSVTLFFTLGSGVQLLSPGVGIWFTEILLFLGSGWALIRWSGRDPVRYARLFWPGVKPLVLALLLSVANYFAFVIPLQLLAQSVAPASWVEFFDQGRVFERRGNVELALVITGAVVAAPIGEEFVFRALYLQGLLRSGLTVARAVMASAIVFSICHWDPIGFPARLELGVLFGLLFCRTGSLWPGIVAHFGNNLTATVIYLADRLQESPGTTVSSPNTIIVGLAGMGLAAMAMILYAARSIPGAWGQPREIPAERPRVQLSRATAPWVLAAGLIVAGWLLIDRRGVELDMVDLKIHLPTEKSDEADWVRKRRVELEALRSRVRRGEVGVQNYAEARRAFSQELQSNVRTERL